jgi:hypothetical protein
MGKRKKKKKKRRGKKKKGDASAPIAAIGRVWPTGGRAARDWTAARKKRGVRPVEKKGGTMNEVGYQDGRKALGENLGFELNEEKYF